MSLQARWGGWTRPDGTNTTWDDDLLHPDDLAYWRRIQTCRRRGLADESSDIEIWGTLDIHNTATHLRAQGYQEKHQRRKDTPLKHKEIMATLLGEKLPGACGDPRATVQPISGVSLRLRRQATDSSAVSVASSSRSSASFSSVNNITRASSATSISVSTSAPVPSSSKPRRTPSKNSPSPVVDRATPKRPIKKLSAKAQKAATPKVTR
jgi:histone-lysine N-methyltransferase SUV39H